MTKSVITPRELLLAYLDRFGGRGALIEDPEHFRFQFACPSSCWGTCCGLSVQAGDHPAPLFVALTPWDVYQIGQAVGKSMRQVINDYCHVTDQTKEGNPWPLVFFRAPAECKPCEFLTPDRKCGIYQHRPEACRSAPIARMMMPTGKHTYLYAPPHRFCQTRNENTQTEEWTLPAWVKANEVDWTPGDDFLRLGWWAAAEVRYTEWAPPDLPRILGPLMFSPDEFVPPGTPAKEMFRRSHEAVRLVLTMLYHRAKAQGGGAVDANDIISRAERLMAAGVDVPEPGRNDPCPCRSGRKFKKCCGR